MTYYRRMSFSDYLKTERSRAEISRSVDMEWLLCQIYILVLYSILGKTFDRIYVLCHLGTFTLPIKFLYKIFKKSNTVLFDEVKNKILVELFLVF